MSLNKVNIQDFTNNINEYPKFGAQYIGAFEFEWDQLDMDERKYQTRVQDLDQRLIAELASDIDSIGLKTLPIVEYNSDKDVYTVLSGHHRMQAQHRNNVQKLETNRNKYKAIVLEFQDDIKRFQFLQHENNHRPSKAHGKADAIFYIETMKSLGLFDYTKNQEVIKEHVYKLLDSAYPRVKGPAKQAVLEAAFKWRQKKVKVYTVEEATQAFGKIHGHEVKNVESKGDVTHINVVFNAARKAIYVANADRVKLLQRGSVTNRMDISMVTRFPSGTTNIKAARKSAIEELTLMNNKIWGPSDVSLVTDVTFLPQILHPSKEVDPIKYVWSENLNKFQRK